MVDGFHGPLLFWFKHGQGTALIFLCLFEVAQPAVVSRMISNKLINTILFLPKPKLCFIFIQGILIF